MPIYKRFNIKFFKKWNPDLAYILGFFCADGSMDVNPIGSHYLSFYGTDKKLLETIKKKIGSEHKLSVRIGNKNNLYLYRLQIGSKELFRIFENYGLGVAKSKVMRLPSVPQKLLRHFIRGYFDGDGNVWVGLIHKKRRTQLKVIQTVFTSASGGFLLDLKNKLRSFGINGAVSCRETYFRLSFSILSSLKLYDLMYSSLNNKNSLFLKRKKVVFEDYLKMRP